MILEPSAATNPPEASKFWLGERLASVELLLIISLSSGSAVSKTGRIDIDGHDLTLLWQRVHYQNGVSER